MPMPFQSARSSRASAQSLIFVLVLAFATLATASVVRIPSGQPETGELLARALAAEGKWPDAAVSLPIRHGVRRAEAGNDPFYTPPAGFGDSAPGTVFRSRRVTILNYPNDARKLMNMSAYQLLYRTTSANNSVPITTITTLMVPQTSALNLSALVEYPIASDAVAKRCMPGYGLTTGGGQLELLLVYGFFARGWVVSSSDYEGPDGAFAAGHMAGHGILDSLRAVRSFKGLGFPGFNADVKMQVAGYSGGALATNWAVSLAPTYAPELPLIGAVSGGTPANVSQVLEYLDGTLFAGYGMNGLVGLTRAYSDLDNLISTIFTKEGKAALQKASTLCGFESVANFAFERVLSTKYQKLGDRLLYNPRVRRVTEANVLGVNKDETPKVPMFIYHSQYDEEQPVPGVESMIQRYCDHGIPSLVYEKDIGPSEHITLAIFAAPKVVKYLADRFDGIPASAGCSRRTTFFPPLDADTFPTTLTFLRDSLLTIFTGQIGVSDSVYKANILKAWQAKQKS